MTVLHPETRSAAEARRRSTKRQASLFLLLMITAVGFAEDGEPKGIESYFRRLPSDSTFLEGKSDEILRYMRRDGTVDSKNGYLFHRGDGAQVSLQVALFRYRDGSPLLTVSYGYLEQTDFTQLAFFLEKDGEMISTNAIAFPLKPNGRFVYQLPRYGRVITVKDEAGKLVAKLRFDGERFVAADGVSSTEVTTPVQVGAIASGEEETVRMGRVQLTGTISREQDSNGKGATYMLTLEKPLRIAGESGFDHVSKIHLIPGNEAQRKELESMPKKVFKTAHFIFLGTLKEDSGFKRLSLTIVKFKPIGL